MENRGSTPSSKPPVGALAGYESLEAILEVWGACTQEGGAIALPALYSLQSLYPLICLHPHCHRYAQRPAPQDHLPPEQLCEVKRVLHGYNCGEPVAAQPLPAAAVAAATTSGFDLQGYRFRASTEQMRPPRVVRVGLIQHAMPAQASAPYLEQREAVHARVRLLIDAASAAGVQVHLVLGVLYAC